MPDFAALDFRIAGQNLRLRYIVPEDAGQLAVGLESLTEESRVARFFFAKRAFSQAELEHLTGCDRINHLSLVVEWIDDPQQSLVAVGRWIRDQNEPTLASVAYVTCDRWQRRGIGTLLVRQLAREAVARNIAGFRAEILWGNSAAVKLLERIGVRVEQRMLGAGASEMVYRFTRDRVAALFAGSQD